jgi:UDP-glucose 4-epimerase
VFRYFNACGAEPFNYDLGQEPEATHIVARALEASINKKEFWINGNDYPTPDGTCIRDYVHVWDIALAHVRAAEFIDNAFTGLTTTSTGYSTRTASQLTFNLGTNTGISNLEIAKYVKEKYGLNYVSSAVRRLGDPAELVASSDLAKEMLKWEPQYSTLPVIIDSAYRWYTRGV